MKFKLQTAQSLYEDGEESNKLKGLGFRFKPYLYREYNLLLDDSFEPEIEISNLEELVAFSNKWGQIVFSENLIIIYNGYLE